MKCEVDALELERQQAAAAAETNAKRSRRLSDRAAQLIAYALQHVAEGDEAAARSALEVKASIRAAMEGATERALANFKLASKLEVAITSKQEQLMAMIWDAKEQVDQWQRAAGAEGDEGQQRRQQDPLGSHATGSSGHSISSSNGANAEDGAGRDGRSAGGTAASRGGGGGVPPLQRSASVGWQSASLGCEGVAEVAPEAEEAGVTPWPCVGLGCVAGNGGAAVGGAGCVEADGGGGVEAHGRGDGGHAEASSKVTAGCSNASTLSPGACSPLGAQAEV